MTDSCWAAMISTSLILLAVITLTISSLTSGASEDEFVKNLTDPTRYNAKVRPEGYQVVDNISAYITNIAHVDDIRREYLLQITLTQQWQDSRLNVDEMIEVDFQFPPKGYVSITDSSLIWTPDIAVTNAVSKKDVIGLDKYIRIYPNGTVVFSKRMSLVMTCNMDFKYFPHDTQCCNVTIEAVAHTDDVLHLEWRTDIPIEVNPNIEIPLWSIENVTTSARNIQKHGGNFSCLDIMIDTSRQTGYYLLLVYFPIMTLVLIALVSLWVKEIRDRYIISFLPLLIITILFIYFEVKFPPNSAPKWPMYSKIIDAWMSINLTFVFVTLLIHATIDFLNLEGQYSDERERSPRLLSSHGNYDRPDINEESGGNDERQSPWWSRKAWRHGDVLVPSRGILWLLRIIFPIAYFTFLGIYAISVWLVS